MSWFRLHRTLPVVAALMVTACATRPALLAGPSCSADSLLVQYDRYGSLGSREAEAALTEARTAFQRTGSECDRLRLALLLGNPEGKAHRDDAQALKLLNGFLAGAGTKDPSLTALSRYAAATLASRSDTDARLRSALKKAADERGRADALQKKIDEVKEIEALLQERQRK